MRLAAIDLGSNSFRLEIARVEKEVIISEGSWKETVRLAGGIDSEGNLTEAAQDRALKLKDFLDHKSEQLAPRLSEALKILESLLQRPRKSLAAKSKF